MPPPIGVASRPFAGRDDLRAIGALMSATWMGPRRPVVPGTVGDVEWWTAGGGPDADWPARVRIWERDRVPVAWGWFNPPGGLDWFVGDGLSDTDETAVRGEILEWFADRAQASRAATPDATGVIKLETWGIEGSAEETILRDRGWTASDTALSQFVQPLDLELDPPRVLDGYTLRHLRGVEDFPARVEVHRAAFAPSRMTLEKYELLPGLDHYRFEHDLVIEAPDGTFAAFAICWIDPVGSVGEFEPVGTHPDHQRRGLGKAIMRAGLRLMRERGVRDALVFSLRSNAASEALYQSTGFERVATHREYTFALEP